MAKYLVTGCAGFIAYFTSKQLLKDGYEVVGIDNLNDYYDVVLKQWRLNQLLELKGFEYLHGDIENLTILESIFADHKFDSVINLAARAGVRYSMENPFIYMSTNAQGTLNLLA